MNIKNFIHEFYYKGEERHVNVGPRKLKKRGILQPVYRDEKTTVEMLV